jgi:hypothetical protein
MHCARYAKSGDDQLMRPDEPLPPEMPHQARRRGVLGWRANMARRSAAPTHTALERLLREAYAAPVDQRYWDQLESRIVARVQLGGARPSKGWTAAFGVWGRAGVAAACIAAVAAGLATWSTRDTEARVAYETVLDVPSALPVQSDTRFIDVSDRDASVRYVLSH